MALQAIHVLQKSNCLVLVVSHLLILLIRPSLYFLSKAGKVTDFQLSLKKYCCLAVCDPQNIQFSLHYFSSRVIMYSRTLAAVESIIVYSDNCVLQFVLLSF